MGPFAFKGDGVAVLGQTFYISAGIGSTVHHKCHIQLFKTAVFDHLAFRA